jgi:biotin synthase
MSVATYRWIAALARRSAAGQPLMHDDAMQLATAPPQAQTEILRWAGWLRREAFGDEVRFCSIVPSRLGGCSEDCAWCGQSRHAGCGPQPPTELAEIEAAARASASLPAACFCIVSPGRRAGEAGLALLRRANAHLSASGLPPACASLGELDDESARRLRACGVVRYNHNLETSRRHFARVVTTHTYDDRLATLRAARSAGLELCCGGIFGIGEDWADRVELALTLRDAVRPEVTPLNFLDPRPGTPLGGAVPLGPDECLRIIALFRFVLPRTEIKVAGGRRLLGPRQDDVFAAGASALMVGNYLTTCGRSAAEDVEMVARSGLKLVTRRAASAKAVAPR